jgi:hypothetical protein
MRSSRLRFAVGLLSFALFGSASAWPAQALQINAVYDSSVTSRSDFAQIKSAFSQAGDAWSNVLSDNVTVNIRVSWGSVGGYVLGNGTLGGSLDSLYGYFSYSQIKSWLNNDSSTTDDKTALKNLPLVSSVAGNKFVLSSAEAKALGLVTSYNSAFAYDGYIGFGNGVKYDYDRSNGISAGYFDFVGLVEHEIDHVLGHFSGLGDGYATPFDLFRCSNGSASFSGSTPSYFSIDGCKTNLATFNTTGSGDRDDWASSSTSTDIQGAYLYPGILYGISAADITALDVIGWGTKNTLGGLSLALGSAGSISRAVDATAVPVPSTLVLVAVSSFGLWLVRRRRQV